MKNKLFILQASIFLSTFSTFYLSTSNVNAALLVGNTRANNVVIFDEQTGNFLGDFITPGRGGLVAPDDLTYGPNGDLYVSSGDKPENSANLNLVQHWGY